MGGSCSELEKTCGKECDRDRRCYVDQNEVKFGPGDPNYQYYPDGKLGPGASSTRSTAATSAAASYCNGGPTQLAPQSVTWADGLFRKTAGGLLGRFQLTPKASSFAGGGPGVVGQGGPTSQRAVLTFEQQMGFANPGRGKQTSRLKETQQVSAAT
ncbi:unnamed protein product [Polarella glacialis]|uniref:Uncharacterized protein n=1 Tax=Polarella glacialis TaxID=89957 RepID=A0A813IS22_POLGL|nr:unnamed protein product [Polarella glacialis]